MSNEQQTQETEQAAPDLTAEQEPSQEEQQTQEQQTSEQEFDGPEFLKGVDPELLEQANLKTFQDVETLAKSYVHAQKQIGKDKITLPGEHASDQDWQEVYKKLGLPDKENYEVDFGEAKYDEEFKKEFQEKAHEAGLLPHQAKEVFEFWNSKISEASQGFSEEQQQKQQEEIENLRKEWGAGFDKELKTAQTALKQFADEGTIEYLKESGLGNDPKLIKLFNQIGKSMNEDTFNRDTVKHLGTTKEEAQEKINEMLGQDQTGPYWNPEHPGHKKAVEDMMRYQEAVTS